MKIYFITFKLSVLVSEQLLLNHVIRKHTLMQMSPTSFLFVLIQSHNSLKESQASLSVPSYIFKDLNKE